MDRRHLLGTGLALLAGCLSDDQPASGRSRTDNRTDERTETQTTTTETATSTDPSVSVGNIVVRKAVTYESYMGSGGVITGGGRQYVVASIGDDSHEFTFETESDSWESSSPTGNPTLTRSVAGQTEPFIFFNVPAPLDASDPRIELSDGESEWPLSDQARESLAAPEPEFELDDLSVPESIPHGTDLSVSLTVTNVAETEGRFLAALYWPTAEYDDDESHIIDQTVDAGEQVTVSRNLATFNPYAEDPVTFSVSGHVSAERAVTLTDSSTPE